MAVFSCRRSMISTLGIGRPPTRLGIEISVYRPSWAFRQRFERGRRRAQQHRNPFHLGALDAPRRARGSAASFPA